MLRCSDLQNELALYCDSVLDEEKNEEIEVHLGTCPLCRQRLDEFRAVRRALAGSRRPQLPGSLLSTIKLAVAAELGSPTSPRFALVEHRSNWFRVWLMPFSIAGAASVLLALSMLWFVINSVSPNLMAESTPRSDFAAGPVMLAGGSPSPGEYASSRTDVSNLSPSVNPQGSLVQLSKLLVSNQVSDDEVVVVADVFGNGSAQIAQVVEPPRDKRAARELERAFSSDLAYAPFVPAGMDQRSDRVRVVFRIQSVSVYSR